MTLLTRLLASLASQSSDTLIFLGDYLDRGEDALATIQTLLALSRRCLCIFLRGNHDAAWLGAWNGTVFTRCPAIPGARAVWDQYHGGVPPIIGRFLEGTRLCCEDGDACYSHAGASQVCPSGSRHGRSMCGACQGFSPPRRLGQARRRAL